LTYAAGLKMARPDLHVIVTMGDGGLGIGGAHLLAACRRNLDVTLMILNNFNFGMTGGQFSVTTPAEAQVGSGFLNHPEKPLDICRVAASAGAAYAARCSAYQKNLEQELESAVAFNGFAVLDIWGVCPGRYTKRNRLTPKIIRESIAALPPADGPVAENTRSEYGRHYRELAAVQKPAPSPAAIEATFDPPDHSRQEVIILGSAGQRIITAGEILGMAGLTAGLRVTQKNDYNITVLRGHSISEIILSPQDIGYTGIDRPSAVIALSQEGVDRRRHLFSHLDKTATVIQVQGIDLPSCKAGVHQVDLKKQGIKTVNWALAALAVLAKLNKVINLKMLQSALETKFKGNVLETALYLVQNVEIDT
jgi:Pyruvate/2-oxoacid:ferredoxin oxidoreductase gamma subunit